MNNLHFTNLPHGATNYLGAAKLLIGLLIVMGLVACSTSHPKAPDYFATVFDSHTPKIKRVALVTDITPPEIKVDLGLTRGESASQGAAFGALEGAGYAILTGPALPIFLPIFTTVGVIGGSVSGTASGQSAEMLEEAEAKAQYMLDSAFLQKELLKRVREYGNNYADLEFIRKPSADVKTLLDKPDYSALINESIDAVLEVKLLRLTLKTTLKIDVRIRLVSTHTGVVLSDNKYQFTSGGYKIEKWIKNAAALLTDEFERGMQTLAEGAVDENFLLYYPIESKKISLQQDNKKNERIQRPTKMGVPHYLLKPIYPKLDCGISCLYVELDSLQPTLRWEHFPREYDLIDSNGQLHHFSDVRYEIRIYEPWPIKQIYNVRDIPEPYHQIKSSLNACSHYKWTVRARFKLNGRTRVTEWSAAYNYNGWNEKPWNLRRGLHGWTGSDLHQPIWFYYRFKTPCNSEKT